MTHQPPDASVPAPLSAEAFKRLAQTIHEEMSDHSLIGPCTGTHLMGYGGCQWIAAAVIRHAPTLDAERQARAADPPTPDSALDRFYALIDGPEPHDYEVVVPVGILRKAASLIWQRGTENGANVARAADPREEGLRAAAVKTRDLLANYLWNEDDSGDDNDLEAAYEELREILGPSTEEGVAETLRPLAATPARAAAPAALTCSRYWGSDGTLCATHNGRFASPSETKCDRHPVLRAAAEPAGLPLDAAWLAKALEEVIGPKRPTREPRRLQEFDAGWNDCRDFILRVVADPRFAREYAASPATSQGTPEEEG